MGCAEGERQEEKGAQRGKYPEEAHQGALEERTEAEVGVLGLTLLFLKIIRSVRFVKKFEKSYQRGVLLPFLF